MTGYFIAAAVVVFAATLWAIGRPTETKAYTITPLLRICAVLLNAAELALLIYAAVHL